MFVKARSGGTIALTVQRSDTIASVCARVRHKLQHLSSDQHWLAYRGKVLDFQRTLSEYKVRRRSTLCLVPRVRGGMLAFSSDGSYSDITPTPSSESVEGGDDNNDG